VRGMPWLAAAGRADPTRRVWYHACELAQSESTGVSHGDRGAPGGGPPVRAVVHRMVKNEAVLVEWQNIANPPVVKVLDEQKSEPAVPRPWREGIPATLPSPILSGMSRLAGPWRRLGPPPVPRARVGRRQGELGGSAGRRSRETWFGISSTLLHCSFYFNFS
jgi:hypothetical protein